MDDRAPTAQLNNLILLNLALPLCSPEQSLAFLRLFYEKNNQRLKKKNHYTPVQVPYAKQDVITTRSQPTKQLTQGMHQHRNQHQQLTRSSNAQDQWMLRAITQPLSPVQKKKNQYKSLSSSSPKAFHRLVASFRIFFGLPLAAGPRATEAWPSPTRSLSSRRLRLSSP